MLKLLGSDYVRMSRWVHELLKVAQNNADNADLCVEIMGTLAQFSPPVGQPEEGVLPWAELCEAGLLDLLHRLCVVGLSEDDLILECVMVVGLMALDPDATAIISTQPKFLLVLQDLLAEKQEDDEIVGPVGGKAGEQQNCRGGSVGGKAGEQQNCRREWGGVCGGGGCIFRVHGILVVHGRLFSSQERGLHVTLCMLHAHTTTTHALRLHYKNNPTSHVNMNLDFSPRSCSCCTRSICSS